jgi:hypothetical protein
MKLLELLVQNIIDGGGDKLFGRARVMSFPTGLSLFQYEMNLRSHESYSVMDSCCCSCLWILREAVEGNDS